VKILVVDDHELAREGLKAILPGLHIAFELDEAATCAQALERASQRDYDLVLLDLTLPDGSGMDALRVLREKHPEMPLVVVSAKDDPKSVLEAIEAGAMGFIPKSSKRDVLLQALRLVLAGGVYLPPAVLDTPLRAAEPMPAPPPSLGLTPRQMEVLRWLIQGKPNKVIARELGVAESTIKVHCQALFRALGATTRTEAVYAAAKLGVPLV